MYLKLNKTKNISMWMITITLLEIISYESDGKSKFMSLNTSIWKKRLEINGVRIKLQRLYIYFNGEFELNKDFI